jgi:hypothetical protein
MSKDLLKALRCFMVEFFDGHQYHASSNFSVMHHLDTLPRRGEPRCIHMPAGTRICQVGGAQLLLVAHIIQKQQPQRGWCINSLLTCCSRPSKHTRPPACPLPQSHFMVPCACLALHAAGATPSNLLCCSVLA